MLSRIVSSSLRISANRALFSTVSKAPAATGKDVICPTIGLTPEGAEFYKLARSFADKELRPYAQKWDEDAHFPMETFKKFGELGFGGMFIKEDVGGSGLSRVDTVTIVEALTTGCASTT